MNRVQTMIKAWERVRRLPKNLNKQHDLVDTHVNVVNAKIKCRNTEYKKMSDKEFNNMINEDLLFLRHIKKRTKVTF